MARRQVGSLAAHQRRFIGRGHNNHRACEAGGAKIVLQEFLHFTPALADETDHRDVRRHIAGQHRQKHRLADAGAREDAHTLPAAYRDERVECAHAEIERLANAAARMCRRRR